MLAGTGQADVGQSALLLDRFGAFGMRQRQQAVGASRQYDGVPFQALGRVQGSERDPLDGRRVLLGHPSVEFDDEVWQACLRVRGHQIVGDGREGFERLPAFEQGPAGGPLRRPSGRGDDVTHQRTQGRRTVVRTSRTSQ